MNTIATQITTPLPLYTRDTFTSSSASLSKTEGDLQALGYTFSSATSESRHDRRLSTSSFTTTNSTTLPPAYSESHRDVVPEYAPKYEPVTLAMYLFRFGFLFPPFWLMGALILITPLRAPPASSSLDEESTAGSWLPEKTEAERDAFISHMRKAEVKWARRCLTALIIFTIIVSILAGATVWATS